MKEIKYLQKLILNEFYCSLKPSYISVNLVNFYMAIT